MDKGGKLLKPFVPQLQTSFVKALSDPSRPVREHSAAALGQLMEFSTRVDNLVSELSNNVTGSAAAETADVRQTMLGALASVFMNAGEKVSQGLLP